MTSNRTKLSKEQLVELIGRDFEEYRKVLDNVDSEHGLLNPANVLEQLVQYGIPLPEGKSLLPKRDGETKSGDVWWGAYHIFYLSIGKTQDELEVFVELGGDTVEQGVVHITNRSLLKHRSIYDHIKTIFPRN